MKYRSCYLLLLLSFSIVYTLKAPEPTEEFVVEVTSKRKTYTEAEKILLAKIIYAESPHEPYEGKLGVGNVVVNRANRKNISIWEVIFQRGQFDGVRSKRFYRVRQGDESAYEECLKAAEEILEGKRIFPESIEFFHNPVTSTDTKWIRRIERYKYKQIGGHLFCHNPDTMQKV